MPGGRPGGEGESTSRRSPIARHPSVLVVLFAAALAAACDPGTPAGRGPATPAARGGAPLPMDPAAALPPAPPPEDWTDEHSAEVQRACQGCHLAPEPSALPRRRWRELIPTMGDMPGPDDVEPPTRQQLGLALAYYERRAPESLAAVPAAPVELRLRFAVENFTPRGLESERIPAVGQVTFVHLGDTRRFDLVVSEMRSGVVMLLVPWAPGRLRTLRPLLPRLPYPVHSEVLDIDGDGRHDLLVAGIGAMNPSNARRGNVVIERASADGKFSRTEVAAGLGRPCDARAADLDDDGDLDLLIAAFGWRGPGELLLFENRTEDWKRPHFLRRRLDDRDGYIHIEPHDFDGDGRLDFAALLAQEHEEVLIYRSEGDGTFERRTVYKAPHPAWGSSGMQLVDLDRDGDADLLLSNGDTLDDDLLKPYHGVRWLENLGALRFEEHEIAALYGCERAIATDLDGDGDLDVVAVAFLPQVPPSRWRDLDSVIWVERDGERWRRHSLERGRPIHATVDAADYDADGDVDLAVGNFVWIHPDRSEGVRADYVTLFTRE